jgi:hypothetical protein
MRAVLQEREKGPGKRLRTLRKEREGNHVQEQTVDSRQRTVDRRLKTAASKRVRTVIMMLLV